MSLLEEMGFGTEAEMCSDISYSTLLVDAEMLLVGAELWRTTVTWSEASVWSELTTVDMFTSLHVLPSLGEGGGMLVDLFLSFFFLKGAACHSQNERVGRTPRAEMKEE